MTAPIDLRSDTVTKPSPQMREAMAQADVDDDVIDIDPTVDRLQKKIADFTGKQAALFVPSGTMSNQIGLRIHCQSGDEFICESQCHIYSYEQGAYASLSGLAVQLLPGEDGVLDPAQFIGTIKADNEHFCRTKLVCLENTHNRGGGRILPYDGVAEICNWAHDNGLSTHLDGARLFNAAAASGIPAAQWAQHFDTVSICFSKGLGAPVGSALCGTKEMIAFARRHRKMLGGGMRQAGIIAAGALYALEHNLEQLHTDNQNAQQLAQTIRETEGLQLAGDRADTNIVMFDVSARVGSPSALVAELESQNVRCLALGPTRVRMVTHLDVSKPQIDQACEILNQIVTTALKNDRKLSGSGAQY